MTDRIDIECEGTTYTIERLHDGSVIVNGIDIEKERSLAELGFEPHPFLLMLDDRMYLLSQRGETDLVDLLLCAGADVNFYDEVAVKWAAHNGHTDTVRLLVEKGADIHIDKDWPLRYAAARGHKETVILLLELGANANAPFAYVPQPGYDHEIWKIITDWIYEHG